MENLEIANQIRELGLNAPKVDFKHITQLMEDVVYEFYVIPNTTTTVAFAIYHGFTIAQGQASCVDPANFNTQLGMEVAIDRAQKNAESELWKLEGWILHRSNNK